MPPQLVKEKKLWGIRLSIRPFENLPTNSHLEIEAQINNPNPGRRAEIKIGFQGTPIAAPLRLTDAPLWLEAFRNLLNEARAVADKIGVAPKEEEEKKAAPKKKAARKK